MNTIEIIKNATALPFRAYKGFALVTILFFISEIVSEMTNTAPIDEFLTIKMAISLILGVIILGICIAIVYHYIYDSFDIWEVSLTTTAKAGINDTLIETYYYFLAIFGTIFLSYILGIYNNIYSIVNSIIYVDEKFYSMTLPKILHIISSEMYRQLAFSVIATLAIFTILFALCFSYCSFAKIRMKETGDMKESMNFIKLTQIIKSKGIRKYLNFVVLNFIVFGTVLIIMKTLEVYLIFGSLISSMSEAFALFFILDSYCLFYYS